MHTVMNIVSNTIVKHAVNVGDHLDIDRHCQHHFEVAVSIFCTHDCKNVVGLIKAHDGVN